MWEYQVSDFYSIIFIHSLYPLARNNTNDLPLHCHKNCVWFGWFGHTLLHFKPFMLWINFPWSVWVFVTQQIKKWIDIQKKGSSETLFPTALRIAVQMTGTGELGATISGGIVLWGCDSCSIIIKISF